MIEIKEPGDINPTKQNKYVMNKFLYKFLQGLVRVILPGIGSLYFVMDMFMDFPFHQTSPVLGVLLIVTFIFGCALQISSARFICPNISYDGELVVMTTEEGKKMYSLELSSDPEDLTKKDTISFKVHPGVDLD